MKPLDHFSVVRCKVIPFCLRFGGVGGGGGGGGRTNWSLRSPPASELRDGYPSVRVIFNFPNLLQSH